MSDILARASDLILSYLPVVISLFISSGFIWYLARFLCMLIIDKIRNKTKDKFSKPIFKEIQQLREEQKQIQEQQGKQIVELVKKAFEEEAERKRVAYEEVMHKPIVETIIEKAVEVPAIEEPKVEEVVEKKEPTEYKVAKRVIADE